jgi:hypothetical protein
MKTLNSIGIEGAAVTINLNLVCMQGPKRIPYYITVPRNKANIGDIDRMATELRQWRNTTVSLLIEGNELHAQHLQSGMNRRFTLPVGWESNLN